MKKEKNIFNSKIFSKQAKEAILLACLENKKYGNKNINSKILLYSILKVNGNLIIKNFNNLNNQYNRPNTNLNRIIFSLKSEIKRDNKRNILVNNNNEIEIAFTRPVRKLLFLVMRSLRNKNTRVITTLDIFNYLIKNKTLKVWINNFIKKY